MLWFFIIYILLTKFPDSKSCATEFCTDLNVLEDSMTLLDPLEKTIIPVLMTFDMPDASAIGVFLLASHTTVLVVTVIFPSIDSWNYGG